MTERAFTVDKDGTRVVPLVAAIATHSGPMTEMRLRKPTYKEIMQHGDPSQVIVLTNGSALPMEDMPTIELYIEKLSGVDRVLLAQLDYADGLALKDAVLDFFRRASASKST